MSNVINMTVSGDPKFIKVCERAAVEAVKVIGVDVETADEIGMAVFEACKAITCHGHDCWCRTYTLNIDRINEGLEIIVQSDGVYNVEKCARICLDCPKEGDLGIAIIKTVMDDVQIEKDGLESKKIIMVKNYAKQNII
jgi:serine/threonine-protein kinase RsbW